MRAAHFDGSGTLYLPAASVTAPDSTPAPLNQNTRASATGLPFAVIVPVFAGAFVSTIVPASSFARLHELSGA